MTSCFGKVLPGEQPALTVSQNGDMAATQAEWLLLRVLIGCMGDALSAAGASPGSETDTAGAVIFFTGPTTIGERERDKFLSYTELCFRSGRGTANSKIEQTV